MAFDREFNLVMKLGVKRALINGVKTDIEASPRKFEGEVWLPASACSFGFAKTRSFDGIEFGALSSIKDMFFKYDDMGIIIADADSSVTKINRKENLYDMTSLASRFIYEIDYVKISEEYAPATEKEIEGFKAVADKAINLAIGKKHPVLFADKEKFAKIKAIYNGEDSAIKSYIQKIVDKAESIITEGRFMLNEDGSDLASPFVCAYTTPEQYDIGGRMGESSYSSHMRDLAFAYLMTGKEEYAKCAYYIGRDLGKWNHWGPCHFLNCAMAARHYAIGYDWLYEAWTEMGFDVSVIRAGLIKNGLIPAYRSMIDDACDWKTANPNSTGWRFKLKKDNWNAVCNCGNIIAYIALLVDKEALSAEEMEKLTVSLGASLVTLMNDGHVLRQYAPDGAYVESNTYWSYGTNSLLYGVGALHSYFGTEFGIMNAPGMDKTCYYAINSESAEFVGWSYHDGETVPQDTSMFNLFAHVTGDDMLFAVRELHLARGKESSIFDILYNPVVLGKKVPPLESLALDSYMEAIDAVTVRDGWDEGSLYFGIMGGLNPKSSSHNHVDSGAFVYHNKGKLWITDIGKDYYNIVGGYFGNYSLYRRNAEGHNVVFIKELPCGQAQSASGKMTRVELSDEKTLAIIDNSTIYGPYAKKALRGMNALDGKRTVVIQDEVEFLEPCEAFAAYHFKSSEIKAEISEDGRACTLTHNDGEKIFLTLLTENEGARFEITSCYDFILPTTKNCEGEYSREDFSRLLINYGKSERIKSAFVIDTSADSKAYTKIVPMENW